ncbi:MAG: DUF3578 domain-containing protein [Candidatus Auribacter fodinae]|jgi:5-methylcytosine-specific restriction protein A|uniref:DUF3578 domain-containing protein n=1 Tax=Candidatus Auribacter fodinae TaxID=2093366 RepID=A0A3A4QWP0_9BACT|nr:MAG: DUF3578 domain-containing protein [Candidatus Auribacter fodinae]
MSLNAALNLFIEEYPKETKKFFSNNLLGEFVRKELPEYVKEIIKNDQRYLIKGSVGQGNWARVPWLAIFDRLVTETATDGYYIVYLVCEDFSGVYLSLNQGVTTVKNTYGSDAKHALEVRAKDFLAQLGNINENYETGIIDLKISSMNSLGALYERGAICSKFYKAGNIPDDNRLTSDLLAIMELYFQLSIKSILQQSTNTKEDDEIKMEIEDLTRIREHKRIERNQNLSRKVKKLLGFTCQACGFKFENVYGDIGKEFIEAHHLEMVTDLKGQKLKLNPKKDFAVLCSNCHRMIHRTKFINNIPKFKEAYIRV